MRLLGHHNIIHTLRYTQLADFPNDDYVCKVAKTVKEASELVEAGFDYVCDVQEAEMKSILVKGFQSTMSYGMESVFHSTHDVALVMVFD